MTEHVEVLGCYCHCEINSIDWTEINLFHDYALFHTKLRATLLKILLKTCAVSQKYLKKYQDIEGGVFLGFFILFLMPQMTTRQRHFVFGHTRGDLER